MSNFELVIRLRPIYLPLPPVILSHSTVAGTHFLATVTVAYTFHAAVGIVVVGVAALAPSGIHCSPVVVVVVVVAAIVAAIAAAVTAVATVAAVDG